jgi:ribonucleoside-diphosphate reductase alpha chain
MKVFPNLWDACSTAQGYGLDISLESSENSARQDWVRRFENFANNYLNSDIKQAEYCLKDAYLFHKWNKIQQNLAPVNWNEDLTEQVFTDVDTMGAAACAGGACEIDF